MGGKLRSVLVHDVRESEEAQGTGGGRTWFYLLFGYCNQIMFHGLADKQTLHGFLGKILILKVCLRLTERMFLMSKISQHFRWLVTVRYSTRPDGAFNKETHH